MDSLSQIVLGAAVGEIMLGKRIGNKAQLLGAIAGTIPDLDVFLTVGSTDPLASLLVHRGYSHSTFVHLLLALPFAWITWRGFKRTISYSTWYWFWFLGFFTHAILDCFTTYGTQLLLPFTNALIGFNNIAVADPFWTLPFMLCLLVCLFIRRESTTRMKWAMAGVLWGSLYLAFTFVNKYNVHQHFAAELNRQGIAYNELSTSPSILNNILWSGMATTTDSIYVAEYSWMQERKSVKWHAFERNNQLLEQWGDQRTAQALLWFGQGKCIVEKNGEELRVFFSKWGRGDFTKESKEETFLFYWRLYQENGVYKAQEVQPQFDGPQFKEAFNQLYNRLWTAGEY